MTMQAGNIENDPLLKQARSLVDTAKDVAKASYEPMLEQFPSLEPFLSKAKEGKRWGLIVTTACVYMAAARLQNLELGPVREAALMTEVSRRLEAWDLINAHACFENCKQFFGRNFEALTARGHEPRFIASDTIGLWIAWNIFNRAPESEDEGQFVRTIGVAITHGFFGWWDFKA
jgi:hypothetical protein